MMVSISQFSNESLSFDDKLKKFQFFKSEHISSMQSVVSDIIITRYLEARQRRLTIQPFEVDQISILDYKLLFYFKKLIQASTNTDALENLFLVTQEITKSLEEIRVAFPATSVIPDLVTLRGYFFSDADYKHFCSSYTFWLSNK